MTQSQGSGRLHCGGGGPTTESGCQRQAAKERARADKKERHRLRNKKKNLARKRKKKPVILTGFAAFVAEMEEQERRNVKQQRRQERKRIKNARKHRHANASDDIHKEDATKIPLTVVECIQHGYYDRRLASAFSKELVYSTEARQHYKRLCLRYHPDKHTHQAKIDYNKVFQALQSAWTSFPTTK